MDFVLHVEKAIFRLGVGFIRQGCVNISQWDGKVASRIWKSWLFIWERQLGHGSTTRQRLECWSCADLSQGREALRWLDMALSTVTDGMIGIYKMATGLSLLLPNKIRWFTAHKSRAIACELFKALFTQVCGCHGGLVVSWLRIRDRVELETEGQISRSLIE